jgi:hypothetical protein
MEWNEKRGKVVFIKLRDGGVYNGLVLDIDERAKPIIFLTIKDKYNKIVTFATSEIIKISEEGNGERR